MFRLHFLIVKSDDPAFKIEHYTNNSISIILVCIEFHMTNKNTFVFAVSDFFNLKAKNCYSIRHLKLIYCFFLSG